MSDPMTRLNTALEGRYRFERGLGEGGMATVYLADDLKHDRKVALKVLKPELAAVVGADRFLAEIKTTANLQHPHVLPLFDSGEADGFLYYVMPYVEGESLRERLDREKQLPVEEAVRIATEVADALGHAHSKGVVHRDVKPANILLRDGRVQVADFGIALAVSAAGGSRLTETGLSVGTPHYMSPEQATGDRELDGRSDVYSLGCVLYEMLTGEPPHTGPTAQSILSKILTEEPKPLSHLRPSVPVHVAAVVHAALEKLPADRFGSAMTFAEALRDPAYGGVANERLAGEKLKLHKRLASFAIATALVAIVVAIWGWALVTPGPTLRFTESFLLLDGYRQESRIAISPDGQQLAFVVEDATGASDIEIRDRDQLESTSVAGTDGAISVFFSPDGTQLGFLVENPLALKVVRPGGPVATVAPMKGGISGGTGGAWGGDGWIYVSGPGFRVVRRYRPDGTAQEDVTTLDTLAGEWWQGQPYPLPGGRGVLFTVRMRDYSYHVGVADLRKKTHRHLVPGVRAQLTPSGHLLVVSEDGTLRAARFDEEALDFIPPFLPVASGLRVRGLASINLAVSEAGTLLYELSDSVASLLKELVWVTPSGVVEPLSPPAYGILDSPAISPDGERIALEDGEDVWLWQLNPGGVSRSRITDNGGANPRWMPGGRQLSFVSAGGGSKRVLYSGPADGSVPPRVILEDDELIIDARWSPMNGWVAFREFRPSLEDIFAIRLGEDSSRLTVAATPANECSPAFSPEGGLIAYMSDESGQAEVYVRPFPNVEDWRLQVSTSGGVQPIWDPGGMGLTYLDLGGAMWSAEVGVEPPKEVTSRRRLFETASWAGRPELCTHDYDVSPKDGRFLMLRPASARREARIVFVEGFLDELQRGSVR